MAAVKRGQPGNESPSGPSRKKVSMATSASTAGPEEMDWETLKVKHADLVQRFQLQQKQEAMCLEKIQSLEQGQRQDDTLLTVINRYWNQLNEDLRVLLERFDADAARDWATKDEFASTSSSFLSQLATWDLEELDEKLEDRHRVTAGAVAKIMQAFDRLQQRNDEIFGIIKAKGESMADDRDRLNRFLLAANADLDSQNKGIAKLNSNLEERCTAMQRSIEVIQDRLKDKPLKCYNLQEKVNDLNWQINKHLETNIKINTYLQYISDLNRRKEHCGAEENDSKVASDSRALRKLANKRLEEIRETHQQRHESLKELETIRMNIKFIPEEVVLDTTEFKLLQKDYSALCDNNKKLERILEESTKKLNYIREGHLTALEKYQKKFLEKQEGMKKEMIKIQEKVHKIKKRRDLMKQNIDPVTVDTTPIEKELKHLIQGMENRKEQLEAERIRYRRKWSESCKENVRFHKQLEHLKINRAGGQAETIEKNKAKDLRSQLKKAKNEAGDVKLILGMYKEASKEQHEKAELMLNEVKLRREAEDAKKQVKSLRMDRKKKKKSVDEIMTKEKIQKRIIYLEEQKEILVKQVKLGKLEEEMLVGEMDVTKQACEDIQAKNMDLIEQLKGKEEDICRMGSERMKDIRQREWFKEEIEGMRNKVTLLQKKLESGKMTIRVLEKKQGILEEVMDGRNKERDLRQHAQEERIKKAVDFVMEEEELKKILEKMQESVKMMMGNIIEKAVGMTDELFKNERFREEIGLLERKVNRLKVIVEEEQGAKKGRDKADAVMQEEIRVYKATVTCPLCRVNRKDGLLTKCFHVFCFECLRTRYEMKQRKCPECGLNFGPNDFHRLYLF